MLDLTYFTNDRKPQRDRPWAYCYSWPTNDGRKMANMLYDITGLAVDTFQGMQSARSLVIDGKKGKLSNRQAKEPIEGLLTDAEREAEPIEFPEEISSQSELPTAVETNLDELVAGEAGVKIALRKASDELKSLEAKQSAIDAKVAELVSQAGKRKGSVSDEFRERLRDNLTQQFNVQQEQRELRAKLAGTKLQLVEIRRMLLDAKAKEIIERKMQEVLD